MNTLLTIQRSLNGDRGAFSELFEAYKNLVFRTAYLILDDREQAEDALQEVFLRVHHALASYDPKKGAFSTWLYRITVNICLNLKRSSRYVKAEFSLDEDGEDSPSDDAPDPETRLAEDEALGQALDALSDGQRAAIVLRYYSGLSYAETAQALGIPVGTLKSRLNQAHQKLRDELENFENAVRPVGEKKS